MVDRWEGILRAYFLGSSCSARVMASLLVNPHTRRLQQPSKNAILFTGDSVHGSGNPSIERLSRLETVSSILLSKLGDPLANIWVVEASRFNGPFACYEGFLSAMSSHGEPSSYDPHNLPSSQATTSMLHNCLAQVRTQISQMNKDDRSLQECNERIRIKQECREDAPCSTPKTLLFGFSKGGVVLNQLLSEMSYMAKHGELVDTPHKKECRINTLEASSETFFSEQAVCPTSSHNFLASIIEFHFLDVGLNCHGAYLTNTRLLEDVVKAADASSSGLLLRFHGTPRQWKDPQRPWIATEKGFCARYLRTKAEEKGIAKLVVSEKIYFEHAEPNLQMHFEILESFDLV